MTAQPESARRGPARRDDTGPAPARASIDALLASAPVGVALFGADLRFDRVNEPFLALLGVADVASLGGRHLTEVPGVPARLVHAVQRALERGRPGDEREIVVPETGPPGTRRHYLVRCFPVLGPGGAIEGAGAVSVDVTDRRHSEAAVGLVVAASDLFASSAGYDEMVRRAVALPVPLFADACVLSVCEESTGSTRWWWTTTGADGGVHVETGPRPPTELDVTGVVDDALRSRRTRRVRATPETSDPHATHDPARSLIAAPMISAGRVLGAMTFVTTTPGRRYVRESELVADELARRCADAIENARLADAESRARARLELLARIGELMMVELDSTARLDGTTRLAIPDFADLCVVYLLQADGRARLASFAHADAELESLFVSLSEWPALEPGSAAPPMRAIRENRPVLVTDVDQGDLTPFLDDDDKRRAVTSDAVRSMLAVPLPTPAGPPLGSLAFAYSTRNYVDDDVSLAVDIARRVAPAVENALRFEQEHQMAETLQRSLLPEHLAEPDAIELVARYLPAAQGAKVGGDWYDVLPLGDGRTMFVIGDVLGHGIRAAASMSRLRTAFQVYALEGLSGPKILERLNAFVTTANRHGAEATMASMLVAEHDARSHRVLLANAGHVPPCLRSPAGDAMLAEVPPCTPVGAVVDAAYAHTELVVEPGAVLLLYTDGLVERRQEPLDDSFARLVAAVADAPTELGALADHVLEVMLDEHANDDDVAVIALRPQP